MAMWTPYTWVCMRFLLAILAVLALAANPVAAARSGCGVAMIAASADAPAVDTSQAMDTSDADMSAMDMSGMDQAQTQAMAAMPCCDPAGHHHKTDGRCCAEACALAGGFAGVLTGSAPDVAILGFTPAALSWAPSARPGAFETGGPERPPKSIA